MNKNRILNLQCNAMGHANCRVTVVSILIRGKSRRRARANLSKSEILESSKSDLGKKYQSMYFFVSYFKLILTPGPSQLHQIKNK